MRTSLLESNGDTLAVPQRQTLRLLQVSPEEARRVICAPKEVVEEFQEEVRATEWLQWFSTDPMKSYIAIHSLSSEFLPSYDTKLYQAQLL